MALVRAGTSREVAEGTVGAVGTSVVAHAVAEVVDGDAGRDQEQDHEVDAQRPAETLAVLEVVGGDLDLVDDC